MNEVTPQQMAMDRYHALFGPVPPHLEGYVGGRGHGRCATHQIAQVMAGLQENWHEFPEWFQNQVREKLVVEKRKDGSMYIGLL